MPASPETRRLGIRSILTGLAMLGAGPAAAREAVGIGFVRSQAETVFCLAAAPATAFACAMKKCADTNCAPTRWCHPAGWSGAMLVYLSEFRSTVPVCGAPSEAAVREALKVLCAGFDDGSRCDLTRIIDPDGGVTVIDDVQWPGPILAPPQH